MLAKVISGATIGLESIPVTVEVDIASSGLPSFTIVGLPDKAVEESKERVRAAIRNSGAEFPARKITVNLAPADIPKEGPSYDLPMALGILIASGQISGDISNSIFLGELSLDGSLKSTKGVLPLSVLAKEKKYKNVFLPYVNSQEGAVIRDINIFPVMNLISLFRHFAKSEEIKQADHIPFGSLKSFADAEFDMADIKGQEQAKRAMMIAASGGHNVYMKGVPGAGKTMMARALPGILPDLTETEAIEVTKIYSITGNIPQGQGIITSRPFRAPHHTTSRVGLIGGGSHPMPGEISLAYRGVLFLDEFPEFPRHVLEALRQPIEDGIVSISRASGSIIYPAKFLLLAAANPCPCGYYASDIKKCTCMPGQIAKYQKRVSGPIMDRIDLHLDIAAVKIDKLTSDIKSENSSSIKEKVQKARNIQTRRFAETSLVCNNDMNSKDAKVFCPLNSESGDLLKKAIVSLGLSARNYFRTIKLSRTIADLEGEKEITVHHVAEALQYRPRSNF